jgi:zinc protease
MARVGASVRHLLFGLVVLVLAVAEAPGDDKPLLNFRSATLENGLHVLTVEDHCSPIVAVHLWYHVGSKDENPERQGFAHMFEHMMFRGTDRLGAKDHFDLIRRCGGDCNAYTNFDQTVYVQTLPANQLELALWLEAERMGFLKIDQEAFDTERKVVEEERRLGLNRPYGTVPEKLVAEIFKHHPYGWTPIGKISHLRASAAQELRDFWMRYYVPNNATLVIAGDVKHEQAQKLAQRYFGWMPREADPPRVRAREPAITKPRHVNISEDNAPAPVVGVGWRTVPSREDDHVVLQLLSTILGDGNSSRLYRQLVTDKQLAVMAMAGSFSLEQEGFFGAGAVLSPFGGDTKKALEALQNEIDRLRAEPVSAQELTKAKNQLLTNLVTQSLTVASKATALGSAAVLEGDPARVNRRRDLIQRATPADLQRVAKQYLAPEACLTVTVERNLLGSVFGSRSPAIKEEENAPITARPETTAPPPGKPGLRRPADFPAKPPTAALGDAKGDIPHVRHVLPNGLKVLVVSHRDKPYVSVQLGLLTGAWTENKPGVASMTMGMLNRGTINYTGNELAEELETHAIRFSASADMDAATVSVSSLPEHVDRAMKLLGEMVLNPTFPEAEFDKLHKRVRTEVAMSAADPATKAGRELRRRLYGHHPYARVATGEMADVDALRVDDLKAWWKKFPRPDQAVLIFAGDIDADRAIKLAEATLGGWQAPGPKPDIALAEMPPPTATHIYLVDHPGVQSQIRVGQRSIKQDHPEYPTARVVGDYFGGSFNSRLNETIRVQKGLTYGARGGFYPARFGGEFSINTFSKTESTAEAVKAVFDELARLRREPPSTTELNDAKSHFIGSFPSQRETPLQAAGQLWAIESLGLPGDHYDRLLEKVARADAGACTKLVQEMIDPAQMVVVVVGHAARIKEDLEKVAPVTVVKPEPPGGTKPATNDSGTGSH